MNATIALFLFFLFVVIIIILQRIKGGISYYNKSTDTVTTKPSKKQSYEFIAMNHNGNQFMSAKDKLIYMQTEEWSRIKISLILMNHGRCEICGESEGLESHHISYERLGDELLSHLALLCRSCHQCQHDEYGYNRTTIYLPLIKPPTSTTM